MKNKIIYYILFGLVIFCIIYIICSNNLFKISKNSKQNNGQASKMSIQRKIEEENNKTEEKNEQQENNNTEENNEQVEQIEETAIVGYKESILKKIINRILNIFKFR